MQQWGMLYRKVDATDVVVDANDPNTTPPPADRVFRQKLQPGGSVGAAYNLVVYVGDGTSLVVEVWIKDETGTGRWWLHGKGTVTVPADGNTGSGFYSVPGALTFVRITTNNGNVQRYAVGQA